MSQSVARVDIDRQLAAGRESCRHSGERRRGIRRVMKDADGVGEVERALAQREREDVRLREVDVLEVSDIPVCGVDRLRDVDAEDLGAFRGGPLRKSTGSDAGIQQPAPAVLVVAPTGGRAQGVLRLKCAVEGVHLHASKPMPLMAETLRVGLRGHESRNAARDRVHRPASGTGQAAFENFKARS